MKIEFKDVGDNFKSPRLWKLRDEVYVDEINDEALDKREMLGDQTSSNIW